MENMYKTAFLFPGQGSQKIGMGKDFYDNYSTFRSFFDHASEILDIDLKELCFSDNDRLNKTAFTQPAILSVSLGVMHLLNENGVYPSISSGYSLGEYASLVASGIVSEDDALRIIKIRGMLMDRESGEGKGGMAAIIGLSNAEVEDVIKNMENIGIANYNYDGQVTISGSIDSVQQAMELLKQKGARRCVRLAVSGPFHSPLLKKAGEELFETALKNTEFHSYSIPYIPNVTGTVLKENEDVRLLLSKQVYSPVRWSDSMDTLIKSGYNRFIEVGTGHVLSGFLKKRGEDIKILSCDSIDEFSECIGDKR